MRRSLLFLALLAMAFTASARSEEKTAPGKRRLSCEWSLISLADEKDKGLWSDLRCTLARGGLMGSIWMGGFGRWNVQFAIENDGKELWIELTEAKGVTLGSSAEKPVSLKENTYWRPSFPSNGTRTSSFSKRTLAP